jgi:hypothetical protein
MTDNGPVGWTNRVAPFVHRAAARGRPATNVQRHQGRAPKLRHFLRARMLSALAKMPVSQLFHCKFP